jgi:hypothetical protein
MKMLASFFCLSAFFYVYNTEKRLDNVEGKVKALALLKEESNLLWSLIRGIVCIDNFFKREDVQSKEKLKNFVLLSYSGVQADKDLQAKLIQHGIDQLPLHPMAIGGMACALFSYPTNKELSSPDYFKLFPLCLKSVSQFYVGWKLCEKMISANTDHAYDMVTGFLPLFFQQELVVEKSLYESVVKANLFFENKILRKMSEFTLSGEIKAKIATMQGEITKNLKNVTAKSPIIMFNARNYVHDFAILGAVCHYCMRENGKNIVLQAEKGVLEEEKTQEIGYFSILWNYCAKFFT